MGKTGAQLCSFILMLAAAAAAEAQAGPVGYWKGDDGASPTTATDSSAGGNNGTYGSGATTSTNVPTLQFTNPTSMQFTTAGATVGAAGFSWPTGGPVTIAFWNNVADASVRNSSAFTVGNLDNANRFHVHAPWGDRRIYWDYGDIGSNGRIDANYATYVNKWTHVALVSAGVAGNFRAIYLDGVEVASGNSSNGPVTALTGVNIGRWPAPNLDHAGLIDDFRIYNYVLMPTQIAALAAGSTEPAVPTGFGATGGPGLGEVSLVWAATPLATGYSLGWSINSGGPYTYLSVAGTSYQHTGLANNATYYYVLSSVNAVGSSAQTSQIQATTLIPPPRTKVVGDERDQCGCGTASAPGWAGLLLAALATALLLYRTRPIANLR